MMRGMMLGATTTMFCLGLSGCGGESPGVATIPAPPVAPAPPAPPVPASVSIQTASVVAQASPTGGRQFTDALPSGPLNRFTVSDPDAPTASRIDEINFDGDESITISVSAGTLSYTVTLPAATSRFGTTDANTYSGEGNNTRYVPVSAWQTPATVNDQQIIAIRHLEEGYGSPSTGHTGNITEHVRFIDTLQSNSIRAFQLAGDISSVNNIPQTGSATYAGQAFGNIYYYGNSSDFLGDAVVNISFGQAFRPVTGRIDVTQFSNDFGMTPFTIKFSGDIVGSAIASQHVDVSGLKNLMAGTLAGNFFGPAADEIGATFSASGEPGNLIGGFVAGKQ